MYTVDCFEFAAEAPGGADVTIDESIGAKSQLLRHLARGLRFPDYFGENWDALIDCLSDLSWWQATEAIIDHRSVPQIPQRDLGLYLESLIDALARRSPDRRPKLRCVFRPGGRVRLAAALAQSGEPRSHPTGN